jgi:hypothetical protein
MSIKKAFCGVVIVLAVLIWVTPTVSHAGGTRAHGGTNAGSGARYGHSGGYYGRPTGGPHAHGGARIATGVQVRYYGGYYGPRYPGYWGARYWGPGYWGPGLWSGYWWGWPYYGYPYYASPSIVVQQPPVYVEPNQTPQEPQYWYYCQNPQGYYPYIQQCPQGWMKVVPPDSPPAR